MSPFFLGHPLYLDLVELFFMKTCLFRNAKPRSVDEGLFCIDEPDIRYGFSPCNNCPLCVPPYDVARRQQSAIRFGPKHKFRFLNGYQTILNCPADCQTENIIYVMTCPCGDFEYIGESSQRLGDRLWCKFFLSSITCRSTVSNQSIL